MARVVFTANLARHLPVPELRVDGATIRDVLEAVFAVQPLRRDRGLPAPACDIVYRHGLVIDNTGSVLAMASTTGSLWISEDGGDSWTSVSQHLPPVYSVRFAPKA